MEEERQADRRIRRSKALLREALTELLKSKSVQEITVTELTRRADVNRGTFYGHYRDIYDMLEQIEDELFCEFAAVLDTYPADSLRHGLRPILRDVFCFIQRNGDMAAALGLTGREGRFLERMKAELWKRVSAEWSAVYMFRDENDRGYCLSFLVGGVIGIVQRWLEGKRAESAEEMAERSETLILRGLAAWEQQSPALREQPQRMPSGGAAPENPTGFHCSGGKKVI